MADQKRWQLPVFLRSATWQGIWIAIRRSGYDNQSRKMILVLIGFVAYVGVVIALQVWSFRGAARDGMLSFQIVLMFSMWGGATIIYLLRKKQGSDDLRIVVPNVETETASGLQAGGVWRSTLILSLWLERAASEVFLATKEIPANVEIVTRQMQMANMRRLGIEQYLPSVIRENLYLPDGHWDEDLRKKVGTKWEYLTVLRWVVQIDDHLRPLDWNPSYDIRQAQEVIERYDARSIVLPSWDVRPHRDSAAIYLTRLWSEAVPRGLITTADRDRSKAADFRVISESEGLEQSFMLGPRKLRDLNDSEVLGWLARCSARALLLDAVVKVLSCETPPDSLIANMFP